MNNKILILKIAYLAVCSLLILAYFLPFSSGNLPDSEVTVSAFQATFGNRSIYGTIGGSIKYIFYLIIPVAFMGTFFLRLFLKPTSLHCVVILIIIAPYCIALTPSSEMFDMYNASPEIAAWIYLLGFTTLYDIFVIYDILDLVSQSPFPSMTLDS